MLAKGKEHVHKEEQARHASSGHSASRPCASPFVPLSRFFSHSTLPAAASPEPITKEFDTLRIFHPVRTRLVYPSLSSLTLPCISFARRPEIVVARPAARLSVRGFVMCA